jgi:hypothetical protein
MVKGGLVGDRTQGLTARVTVLPAAGVPEHVGDEVIFFQLMKGDAPVSYAALKSDIAGLTTLAAHFDVPDPANPAYSIRVLVVDQLLPTGGALPEALSDKVILE